MEYRVRGERLNLMPDKMKHGNIAVGKIIIMSSSLVELSKKKIADA